MLVFYLKHQVYADLQLSNSSKDFKNNGVFYLQYFAVLIVSVRPCWDDTISLLPENTNISLESPGSKMEFDSPNIPKSLYAIPDSASGTQAVLISSLESSTSRRDN
jgi:hypothetical protein